ncbi:MAG: aspartate aminotransferase family protein [Actinobacteria bacterium]|nr:MAG: aspartate aminotransferase family protein [Actinomycetota bacterium]
MTWQERWQSALMNNYGTPPVLIARGAGSRVWDETGKDHIDMIAGIAVNAVGHAHPEVVEAISKQLSVLGHTSNLVATNGPIELAERLLSLLQAPSEARVFFCNSGTEANEAAFKLGRLTGRVHTVVAQGSFHGRTMGALSWTAQPTKQDPFRPLPGEVTVVPFGDTAALTAAVTSESAAVVLEPIQGEGGVLVPPDGYLRQAREICDRHGALLMIDEVQTGIGRTGEWFAFQREGIAPDVVMLAKGLGGGFPIGACIAYGGAASLFGPGSHGSTFGGNPIACAAALAVLRVLEDGDLLTRATTLHGVLAAQLVARGSGLVTSVRGRGLLIAAVLASDCAAELEKAAREHGILVNAVAPNAIRMAPALTITDADIADLFTRWELATSQVAG